MDIAIYVVMALAAFLAVAAGLTGRSGKGSMRIRAVLALILAQLALIGCMRGGGGSALRLAPETIDTILLSDNLYFVNERFAARAESECEGGACTATLAGEEAVITADDVWFLSVHGDAPAAGTIRRNGVGIARIERDGIPVEGFPELAATAVGYGAWADYVAFDVTIQEIEAPGRLVHSVAASVGGIGNRNNPAEGTAEWTGAMVGLDYRDFAERRFVQGDAHVRVRFAEMVLDVALTGIANVGSGESRDDLTWEGVAVRDGAFRTPTLSGSFFGPGHKEVGGVFDRNSIVGAFGAARK